MYSFDHRILGNKDKTKIPSGRTSTSISTATFGRMESNSLVTPVAEAINRCPFLQAVSELQGAATAARLAVNPFRPASVVPGQPILQEDSASSLQAVFRIFHGQEGPIPLANRYAGMKREAVASPPVALPEMLPAMPCASISLAGFGSLPDPRSFFSNFKSKCRRTKKNSKASSSQNKPHMSSSQANQASQGNGKCPMRRYFGDSIVGGLLPLAANGRLECPRAVVAMRSAIAGLKPVRLVRPQSLPIRSLALACTTIAANVPCGMWREHTKKFSPEWFLAVHATIPIVAMLRKAILMPKWALALTIAGAVAGQHAGAIAERSRLRSKGTRLRKITDNTFEEKGSLKMTGIECAESRLHQSGPITVM